MWILIVVNNCQFRTSIPTGQIANTLWMKLNQEEDLQLDLSMFEKAFPKANKSVMGRFLKKKVLPEMVKLIEDKRSYNIDLSLGNLLLL